MASIIDLNVRITKLFRNPNINFFIIMNLILIISCYTFVSTPVKNTISAIISNPIVILFSIISIIIIGYFNINIAVLLLILFFIALYGIQYGLQDQQGQEYSIKENFTNKHTNNTNVEDDADEADDADDAVEAKYNADDADGVKNTKNSNNKGTVNTLDQKKNASSINNLKIKEQNDKKLDTRVNNIKNVVFSTINKFKTDGDNDYKRSILENKKMMFNEEKQNNKKNSKHSNNAIANTGKSKFMNSPKDIKGAKNGKGKEDFQTIKLRTFDPSNEEDTNLLITKEVLHDMSNRIEYNYETNKYLKKYIKHRVEEIVDLNKLLDDE